MMNKKKLVNIILGLMIFVTLIMVLGCNSKKNKNLSDINVSNNNLKELPSLKDQFDFPIGVAVKHPSFFEDEEKSALIKHHFNSITAEYIMKPPYVQPVEGEFNFLETDQYVEFAKENNMQLRGHTLV